MNDLLIFSFVVAIYWYSFHKYFAFFFSYTVVKRSDAQLGEFAYIVPRIGSIFEIFTSLNACSS